MYSLIMNVSCHGGCPLARVVLAVLFFVLGIKEHGMFHPFHNGSQYSKKNKKQNNILLNFFTFSEIPPLTSKAGFVTNTWTLIYSSLHPPTLAKQHTKFSNLLSCSPTLWASSEASRVVVTHMSFSNLSSSSNFLTQSSVSSWVLVANWTAPSRGQPTVAAVCCPSLLQCTRHSSSSRHIKSASVSGSPHIPMVVNKHLPYGPPSPHRGQWPNWDGSHGCLFPKTHIFSLVAGSQIVGLQSSPNTQRIIRDVCEEKERGRPLQINRWHV